LLDVIQINVTALCLLCMHHTSYRPFCYWV